MRLIDLAAAATSAVVAGVYVNFTARVMPRLQTLAPSDAAATMQEFNRTALQPPFMTAFFGGAALATWQLVRFARGERSLADGLAAGAGAAHLVAFALTIAYNVPRNERLDRLDPAAAAAYWPTYASEWTTANTVRAVLALAALGLGVGAVLAARSSAR